MNSSIERILKTIRKVRIFTPDVLAQVLGIDKREVEAVIGLLLSQGKIRVVRTRCPCNTCPLSSICSFRHKDVELKVYELVE